ICFIVSASQRFRAHFVDTDADDLVGSSAYLETCHTERAIQQLTATKGGGIADTVQFFFQLSNFVIQRGTFGVTIRAVCRLQGQITHTLQDIGRLLQCTFSCLRHGNAVVGVLDRNVQTTDLAAQAVGYLQTSGIVLGAVDAATGGQALHGSAERIGGVAEVTLSVQGSNVSVDGQSHDVCPPSDLACLPECATLGRDITQAPIKFAFEVYVGGGF